MRNKEVVLYSFYKNWAYVLVYVYLQFVAGECTTASSMTWGRHGGTRLHPDTTASPKRLAR